MNVRKSGDFIADLERQFEWYVIHAGWEVADKYLNAVEATCRLLGRHPFLGPSGGFTYARLVDWRFFLVLSPFKRHILFYEVVGEEVIFRRAMHGQRDLPRRLLELP